MKRGAGGAFLCAIVLLLGGCCSTGTRVDLSPTHYTVSVMMLELSKKAEEVLNAANEPNPEAVAGRRDVKTALLPTVHVLVGETNSIQSGKSYTYPIEDDSNGTPIKCGSVIDGSTIQAALSLLPDQRPSLAIAVDDTKIIAWEVSPAGNKYPLYTTRSFNTTIIPHLGRWQRVGGMAGTGNDKGTVFLVRLDEPNKGVSNRLHGN